MVNLAENVSFIVCLTIKTSKVTQLLWLKKADLNDFVGFALTVSSHYDKESMYSGKLISIPVPSRFSPRNLNRSTSKSNTR